jgi:hypothetical protein
MIDILSIILAAGFVATIWIVGKIEKALRDGR